GGGMIDVARSTRGGGTTHLASEAVSGGSLTKRRGRHKDGGRLRLDPGRTAEAGPHPEAPVGAEQDEKAGESEARKLVGRQDEEDGQDGDPAQRNDVHDCRPAAQVPGAAPHPAPVLASAIPESDGNTVASVERDGAEGDHRRVGRRPE